MDVYIPGFIYQRLPLFYVVAGVLILALGEESLGAFCYLFGIACLALSFVVTFWRASWEFRS